jgi:hypothetical protein
MKGKTKVLKTYRNLHVLYIILSVQNPDNKCNDFKGKPFLTAYLTMLIFHQARAL